MAARYLVPALAVVARVAAQSSSCSVDGTTTIQSGGDATALASCTTFSGSIAIATGTTGDIALNGIKRLAGSLVANNVTQLTSLSADSLTTIDDGFTLTSLPILTGLTFPVLTSVSSIIWNSLNLLEGLSFAAEIQMAKTLDIEDTHLLSLTGINLEQIDTLTLVNNRFLDDISMQLGNVTTSLLLQANGQNVSANFPNLIWANVLSIQNVSSFSIPSLAATNGSLYFQSDFLSTIAAPNLTTVGGDLVITGNSDLTSIAMPELTTIVGALVIANNSQLTTVNDFAKLATIEGAFNLYGVFTDVEFPGFADVRGAFSLVSTGDISSACTKFNGESGSSNIIKTKPNCQGGQSDALTGDNATSTSSSGASATSSGAANAIVITGATGLLGVVAAIFGML